MKFQVGEEVEWYDTLEERWQHGTVLEVIPERRYVVRGERLKTLRGGAFAPLLIKEQDLRARRTVEEGQRQLLQRLLWEMAGNGRGTPAPPLEHESLKEASEELYALCLHAEEKGFLKNMSQELQDWYERQETP